MILTFTSWNDFKECPKKFRLTYIERRKPSVPRDEYNTIYGKLAEKYFSSYCNFWRFKTPYLPPEVIRERLEKLYLGVLMSSIVDWDKARKTKEEIFEEVYEDVLAVVGSPELNWFLNTKAEIAIEMKLSNNHKLYGRMDFIHKDPGDDSAITIIDGKGSKKKGKYVTDDQLLFYSLLFFLHYKILPAQIGFFYYRFNCFEPIALNMDILNDFRARLSLDIKRIHAGTGLDATPSAGACKFCQYRAACLEGSAAKAARAKKSKLENMPEEDGLVTFGLD